MARAQYLAGVDCGTQSVRGLLADRRGRTLALASRPTPTRHLGLGAAEHDPGALWQAVVEVLRELAAAMPAGAEVAGIACASVGESVVLLDAEGAPLGPVAAWYDRRTDADLAALLALPGAARIADITGMPPDPTLTLPKLMRLRRTDPAGFARARRALNVADWIAWMLCGEAATDSSLATRTLLFDLAERTWSAELLALAGLDPALLPTLRPSGTRLGRVREDVLAEIGLPGRPVVGVGGHDHVVGSFAAGATRPGVLLDSLGTAEALFRTVGGRLPNQAAREAGFWQGAVALDRPFGYIGAGISSSGGAVEWLRGIMGGADRDALIGAAAAVPPGSCGVVFLPHLANAPPPHADLAARGAFIGLTSDTTRGMLLRAVLEGLALEARQSAVAMSALPGVGVPEQIRLIGGGTRNALFLRIKAAAFGRTLLVMDEPEATALGAALLGGLAAGLWPTLDDALAELDSAPREVAPDLHWSACYDTFFEANYRGVYPALAPLHRSLARHATGTAVREQTRGGTIE
jgi:xylulokinase